jgi:hypothetical protein
MPIIMSGFNASQGMTTPLRNRQGLIVGAFGVQVGETTAWWYKDGLSES